MTQAALRDATGQALGLVELRRSRACQTAWTRVVRFDRRVEWSLAGSVAAAGAKTQAYRAKGLALWTDMVFADGACATAAATLYGASDVAIADASASHCVEPNPRESATAAR